MVVGGVMGCGGGGTWLRGWRGQKWPFFVRDTQKNQTF